MDEFGRRPPSRPAAAQARRGPEEPGAPRVLGLVADDLTGAGDAAVAFAERGWRVLLLLDLDHLPAHGDTPRGVPTVLAVSSATRALADRDAAVTTTRVITALRAAGADRVYLKIDSTVRGSVAGQVSGALRAWPGGPGSAHAVICPAFPEHHRTVVEGHVLVDGVPLGRTAAALDPVTPRATGDLTVVLPGARRGDLSRIGRVEQLVLDATSDADLDEIAVALAARGADTVVVGSGGLAAALARCWPHEGPRPAPVATTAGSRVLVAVSSVHPVTLAQLEHLRRGPAGGSADVLTTGSVRTTTPAAAAADLAERVAAAVARHRFGGLVVVGGDGAAAVLRRLGADRVVVDGALSGGCPTGIVAGGTADGLRVVTKSGGFGDPTTLTTLVARLRAGTGPDRRPPPPPSTPPPSTPPPPAPPPPASGPPDRTAP